MTRRAGRRNGSVFPIGSHPRRPAEKSVNVTRTVMPSMLNPPQSETAAPGTGQGYLLSTARFLSGLDLPAPSARPEALQQPPR